MASEFGFEYLHQTLEENFLYICINDLLSDTINKDFILFLLNLIKTTSDDPDQEENVIELIHFILVYNLQFKSGHVGSENITTEALEEAENPKIFSETLLLLFNRGSKQTYLNLEINVQNYLTFCDTCLQKQKLAARQNELIFIKIL